MKIFESRTGDISCTFPANRKFGVSGTFPEHRKDGYYMVRGPYDTKLLCIKTHKNLSHHLNSIKPKKLLTAGYFSTISKIG